MIEDAMNELREGFSDALRDNVISFVIFAILNVLLKLFINDNSTSGILSLISIISIILLLEAFDRSSLIYTIGWLISIYFTGKFFLSDSEYQLTLLFLFIVLLSKILRMIDPSSHRRRHR
jgi:uncharacterized membrane protein HdeD (DUF308 family)